MPVSARSHVRGGYNALDRVLLTRVLCRRPQPLGLIVGRVRAVRADTAVDRLEVLERLDRLHTLGRAEPVDANGELLWRIQSPAFPLRHA